MMNIGTSTTTRKFSTTLAIVVSVMFMLGILSVGQALGESEKAKEIDAKTDAALERFYEQVNGAKEIARKAKGLLILPSVKKGALIIGGEYGQGAMRVGGKTVDYYSMMAGSVGFQIGGEAKDMILAFNSGEALKNFRESKGWEAGVDGNVALAKQGAGESTVTAMANDPIVAYVFGVKGLMADMSLKGAKFSKLDLSK
jgi:lipid-binding SYLF domain-containing protein